MQRMTLGIIIGNRDFFPDVLVGEARRDLLNVFGELGIHALQTKPTAAPGTRS